MKHNYFLNDPMCKKKSPYKGNMHKSRNFYVTQFEQKLPLKYFVQLELERQSEQGDVSNYQANGEFDLVDFSARRNVEYYSCCPEPYPDITYEIRLRRRPMFYVFNLILPCILINGVGESRRAQPRHSIFHP